MSETAQQIQRKLFKKIKGQITGAVPLVNRIAEMYDVSIDSAYRRLRGDTLLDVKELRELCKEFNLSLDQLFLLGEDSYMFSGKNMDYNNFEMSDYLDSTLARLKEINTMPNSLLYHTNRDIPIFYLFGYQSLAQFKNHFWMRCIFHSPEYIDKAFTLEEMNAPLVMSGKALFHEYAKLASVEIWSEDCINSTLMQIEYYREMRIFRSEKESDVIYAELEQLLEHLEKQAIIGSKLSAAGKIINPNATYSMYKNEFLIGDNTLFFTSGPIKFALVNHNVLNYVTTTDERFCEYTHNSLKNLISRSTPISGVNEKERRKFFYELQKRVQRSKEKSI